MKRLLCLIIAIFALIPLSYVNAGVTDGGSGESKIIRKTTTNYHTTIVFKGTFNGEEFTKTSSEIAANYNESKVKTELDKIKKEFKAWAEAKGANKFSYDNGTITDYYYDAHDEITQEKGNDNNDNSDVILVGDPNDMDHAYTQAGNVIINTILDKHQNFEVIGTATFEEVKTTTTKKAEKKISIKSGENQEHILESGDDITISIDADYSLFKTGGKVYVNNKKLDSSNYTSKSGSTVINLKSDYLDTLEVGSYDIKVEFNNGQSVATNFSITESKEDIPPVVISDNTPNETTGQNDAAPSSNQNNTIYYIIGAIILVILIVSGLVLINKNKKKQK